MVLNIADGGLALDSSAKAMAGLPMQAFGITLSDDQLEELIAIAQNGGSIELSLGSDPVSYILLAGSSATSRDHLVAASVLTSKLRGFG